MRQNEKNHRLKLLNLIVIITTTIIKIVSILQVGINRNDAQKNEIIFSERNEIRLLKLLNKL